MKKWNEIVFEDTISRMKSASWNQQRIKSFLNQKRDISGSKINEAEFNKKVKVSGQELLDFLVDNSPEIRRNMTSAANDIFKTKDKWLKAKKIDDGFEVVINKNWTEVVPSIFIIDEK
jgi:hypothetical protein